MLHVLQQKTAAPTLRNPVLKLLQSRTRERLFKLLIGFGAEWGLALFAFLVPDEGYYRYGFVMFLSIHGFLILISTAMQRVVLRRVPDLIKSARDKLVRIKRRSVSAISVAGSDAGSDAGSVAESDAGCVAGSVAGSEPTFPVFGIQLVVTRN